MTVGRQQAELARIRVLGGPDNGVVYVITTQRITMGRGEENDIILTDLKASRRHAEIMITPGTGGLLKDLGSAHGLLVNGKPQKQIQLKSGDKIGLGETVLEFILADAGATRLMVVPPPSTTSVVGTGTSGLTQFIPRPTAQPQAGKPSAVGGVAGAAPAAPNFIDKNKKLIVALGVLMALAVMLPEVEKKNNAKKRKYVDPLQADALRTAGLGPAPVDPAMMKAADGHFKECFREFRANNYLRAQGACEVALQVYPDHALARMYLGSTKKKMQAEAVTLLTTARRDLEAARYKSAIDKCDSIKRLYVRDQSNPLYKEAEKLSLGVEKCLKDNTDFDLCLNAIRGDLGDDINALKKQLKDDEKGKAK